MAAEDAEYPLIAETTCGTLLQQLQVNLCIQILYVQCFLSLSLVKVPCMAEYIIPRL